MRGGLTETRRVASAHLAIVSAARTHIEYLSPTLCDSDLRKNLVSQELAAVDWRIPLPLGPGLGIELNEAELKTYRVD